MSPTLDLARDCTHFVFTFFDVINLSAPHIYHSALSLSPQTSIICKTYKQYARPFFRVVRGVPVSWEPVAATAYLDDFKGEVVWSPCSRFAAVTNHQSIQVVDSVTLSPLGIFQHSLPDPKIFQLLGFSPDSRCLTLFESVSLTSWDLQTGGLLGIIPSEQDSSTTPSSFTHSKDGNAVAVTYEHQSSDGSSCAILISSYDFFSGTHMGTHPIPGQKIAYPIWTQDEYLKFATISPESIRIWQSAFTLNSPPVEVESLPIPDEVFNGCHFLFLPTLSQLAFILEDTIQVWDAKASKFLLKSDPMPVMSSMSGPYPTGSFSSDGCFFAWANTAGSVYVWKESSTGYVIHQQLEFSAYFFPSSYFPGPHLSPNGESIIIPLNQKIHRMNTRDQVLSLPNLPTHKSNLILNISLNNKFAALTRLWENVVTILDLQSGEPRWTTDMGVKIACLGMAGDTVIAVGEKKIVSWNPPSGDYTVNSSFNDSIQATVLHSSGLPGKAGTPTYVSVSHEHSCIVAISSFSSEGSCLEIYDMSAGTYLAGVSTSHLLRPQFTQDGHEVWAANKPSPGEYCEIIKDNESGVMQLKLQEIKPSSKVVFRESPCGYKITDDWWVLSPTQKRFLWLPHHWRSGEWDRTWGRQFLGLLHYELPEAIILEFFE